ncbi:MAG TPA: hypothetical protein VG246_00575 [Acidimicrobiales bacterium]|nr:hypothetical protein [Acidimicrobiales bacterium]
MKSQDLIDESFTWLDLDAANNDVAYLKDSLMADKSPSQHNSKKVGKSLKEKRNDKHAKKEVKKTILGQ